MLSLKCPVFLTGRHKMTVLDHIRSQVLANPKQEAFILFINADWLFVPFLSHAVPRQTRRYELRQTPNAR